MIKWAGLISILVILAGCTETTPTRPAEPPQPVAQEPVMSPEEVALYELPVRQRVTKAIQLLEQGKVKLARGLLESALEEQPHQRTAKRLIAQLDADPVKMLGKTAFTYQVRPGESLSIIAKRFLDDPLKFFILARYNGIDNPSQLSAGQRLRIPGNKRAMSAANAAAQASRTKRPKEPEAVSPMQAADDMGAEHRKSPADAQDQASVPSQGPETPPSDTLGGARQLLDAGNPALAISTLEPLVAAEPGNDDARLLLVRAYREAARRKMDANQANEAKNLLEKALVLAPTDDELLNQLTNVEDQLEARSLYESGRDLAARKEYEKAYDAVSQALIYNPDYEEAAALQNEIRPKLVEQYHRKAMNLFRGQKLDAAIKYWDKVLELDPANSLAPGYRARALELKDKLQNL